MLLSMKRSKEGDELKIRLQFQLPGGLSGYARCPLDSVGDLSRPELAAARLVLALMRWSSPSSHLCVRWLLLDH